MACAQIWWHQHYLASFRSRGSSANNHVIAEAAGLLVAALAFDMFDESPRWADEAARVLEDELKSNTFPSGVNREMAFDYHGFVAELAVVAAAEASWAGRPLSSDLWTQLYLMFDVVAATVDVKLRAPRYGDGDNGTALVLDRADCRAVVGAPRHRRGPVRMLQGGGRRQGPTVTSTAPGDPWLVVDRLRDRTVVRATMPMPASLSCEVPHRTAKRFGADAMRVRMAFLSIAAHGHADALAVEVRLDGVDVLADPGTYCYHGEPRWRSYFRSTLAHNTIEVGGQDQSTSGGPFLWTRQAQSRLIELESGGDGETSSRGPQSTMATGCSNPPLGHRRSVRLDSHAPAPRDRRSTRDDRRPRAPAGFPPRPGH